MSDITVVIVTCNRQAMLRELLENLRTQAVEPEIIVQDDSSYEGYHRVARYNEGVEKVTTPYVILMDDDCIPVESNWAESHLTFLEKFDVARGLFLDSGNRALTPWFSSNNLSMKTSLAKKMGPFDMRYDSRYGYEDVDLEHTFKKLGSTIGIGDYYSAVLHRGIPDDSYHIGLEENRRYYSQKWGIQ